MNRTAIRYLVCLALLPLPAWADTPSAQPEGTWQGAINSINAYIPLELTFKPAEVDVRFSEPFSCRGRARFLKEDGRELVYRFLPQTSGGFCDRLPDRELRILPATTADERMRISFESGRSWYGELRPREPR